MDGAFLGFKRMISDCEMRSRGDGKEVRSSEPDLT